jgi:hypothetical protein
MQFLPTHCLNSLSDAKAVFAFKLSVLSFDPVYPLFFEILVLGPQNIALAR